LPKVTPRKRRSRTGSVYSLAVEQHPSSYRVLQYLKCNGKFISELEKLFIFGFFNFFPSVMENGSEINMCQKPQNVTALHGNHCGNTYFEEMAIFTDFEKKCEVDTNMVSSQISDFVTKFHKTQRITLLCWAKQRWNVDFENQASRTVLHHFKKMC